MKNKVKGRRRDRERDKERERREKERGEEGCVKEENKIGDKSIIKCINNGING